jgi:DNA end-binding protein Ku
MPRRARKESVERATGEAGNGGRCARASVDGELEALSKDDLYESAQRADIPGRSRMSRTQLIKALRG